MSLAKKLLLKPGVKALVLNAPNAFLDALDVPPGAVVDTGATTMDYDFVQVFATNASEVKRWVPMAIDAGKHDAVLWVCWPKKTSDVETDLTRDTLNAQVQAWGLQGVANVSIDETWSALRFRPMP